MLSEDGAERLRAAAETENGRREVENKKRLEADIVDWAHRHFLIPDTQRPIVLWPHQQAVLRYDFRRLQPDDPRIQLFPSLAARVGHFPFATIIYSTPRKGGKSTAAAVAGRYIAEMQSRFGEVLTMGNDMQQAMERTFKFIGESVKLTPGALRKGGADDWVLPGRWELHRTYYRCLTSGTTIRPVSVDAAGEAGANPDLTIWCIPSDTPVLRADLSWVPAGQLKIGERLVGFDEDRPGFNLSRRFRTATVTGFEVKSYLALRSSLKVTGHLGPPLNTAG